MSPRQIVRNTLIALLLLVPLGFAMAAGRDKTQNGEDVDRAFLTAMVAHHDAAVGMAETAAEHVRRGELRRLATAIVETRRREVDELSGAHLRLFSAPVPAGGADPGLGVNQEEMGMGVDIAQLESAADLDRTFIAAMIDHHAGAVRMAEVELRRGSDQAVKDMARRIMSQGSREVERLKAWQNSWYGSRSTPGGGRPRGDGG